jgi:hypothetical protein
VAGLLLLIVGVTIADAVHHDWLIDQALRRAPGPDVEVGFERSANLAGALIFGIPALILAAWLGITSFWLRRGSNAARILTLVAMGAPVVIGTLACCCGGLFGVLMAGLFMEPAGEAFPEEDFPEEEGYAEWDRSAFSEELMRLDSGGWAVAFDVIGVISAGMVALFGVSAAILLLSRSSNLYFRPWRPEHRWPHPAPYYPAQFHGHPAPPYPYPPAHGWYAFPTPPSAPYGPWPAPQAALSVPVPVPVPGLPVPSVPEPGPSPVSVPVPGLPVPSVPEPGPSAPSMPEPGPPAPPG